MAKLLRAAIFMACFFSAGTALAGTYYIAANGSDSSSGTSKTSPWLHAPGMTGCSGNCASYTPVAGDKFLFRGGDTWHYSTGSPIGLPWVWTWSGSSANNIYIGVDQTWFSGSSFTRPILAMDNPLSAVLVTSCRFDDTNNDGVTLSNVSYVTLDDFEFTGKCWAGDPSAVGHGSLIITTATHSLIEHNYFHGWSSTPSSIDWHEMIRGALAPTFTYNEIAYNVIDGSDSFHGTTTAANQCFKAVNGPPCQSGYGVYGDGYNFHHNVLRYLSNGIVTNSFFTVHDNLFEFLWASYDDSTHPNVVESGTTGLPGVPFYFYNNLVRHTRQNVTMWVQFDQQLYMFNNLFFDNFGGSIDCLEFQPASTNSNEILYFYNNTIDATSVGNGVCQVNFANSSPAWNGTANFQNNHVIGYSPGALSSVWNCPSPSKCTVNDNGSDAFQSESVANSQGYSSNSNYAPTSGTGATVGTGANLTSLCSIFSADSALCSGTSLGVIEQAGQGGYIAVSPAVTIVPRPSSGPWDAGAYRYGSGSGSSGQPNPPSELTAVVH